MCGIVGCAGNLTQKESKMFRDMLLFDVVRGQDSTGVVSVPLGDHTHPLVQKDVGAPQNLWEVTPSIFDHRGVLKTSPKVVIGHNRAATVGKITVENAHPFRFGELYGVHNGTLWDTKDLEGNFDIDSKELYYTIYKMGIDHAWKNLCGAAALVWWDHEEKHLCMIRNSERPLYLAWNEKENAIFWASEKWMIVVAAIRNGVKLKLGKDNLPEEPKQIEIHTLYKFAPSSINVVLEEERKLELPLYDGDYWAHWYKHSPGYKPNKSKKYSSLAKPDKGSLINVSWAKGLEKAGKKVRGLKAHIRFPVQTYIPYPHQGNGGWQYYLIGEMESGERLEIYPKTPDEFDRWEKIHQGRGDNSKVIVRLAARPRFSYGSKGNITYHIAADKIEFMGVRKEKHIIGNSSKGDDSIIPFDVRGEEDSPKIYKGFRNRPKTSEELAKEIEIAGCSCGYCDKSLDVESYIEWVTPTVMLCEECCNEPAVQEMLKGM